MTGEQDLEKLLSSMSPRLVPGEFVFVSVPAARYGDHADLEPIASFSEGEGLTLVIPKERAAELRTEHGPLFCCITLDVHSSLDSVGLTAAVSSELASRGISANVFAGYFHDHIFVPRHLAAAAMDALRHPMDLRED